MNRVVPAFALLCSALPAQVVGPQLDPGTTVAPQQFASGVVLDDKTPVGGATVIAFYRKYALHHGNTALAFDLVTKKTTTDAKGEFKLPISPWRHVSLYATHGNKTSKILDEVRAPSSSNLSLELGAGTTVKGQLLFEGKPASGKRQFRLVRVTTALNNAPLQINGETGPDGTFEVTGLPPATWIYKVAATDDRRLAAPVMIDREKHGSGANERVGVRMSEAHTLTGTLRAVGIMGQPVSGAKISLLDLRNFYECTTDMQGRFQLKGVGKGSGVYLYVTPTPFATEVIPTEPGILPTSASPQLQLQVRAGRTAGGRMVDLSGKGVAGLDILFTGRIHISGTEPQDVSLVAKTDKDGKFNSSALFPQALYVMSACLETGELQHMGFVDPRKPDRPDYGTFRLGARRVEVTPKIKGAPLANWELRLYGPKSDAQWTEFSPLLRTPKGTYLGPSTMEGEFVVIGFSKQLGLARAKFEVKRASTGPATIKTDIYLEPPRKLEGVVVDAAGKPLPDMDVTCQFMGADRMGGTGDWVNVVIKDLRDKHWPVAQFPYNTKTDKNGRFTLWVFEGSGKYDLITWSDKISTEKEGRLKDVMKLGTFKVVYPN